jgi:[ribosomal protein S18]-alanine N-acetyltransferase
MNPVTRPPIIGEASAIAALERLCNPQPWTEEAIRPFTGEAGVPVDDTRHALVAVADDRVTGYVLASRAADEAEILILGVHPDFRRRGVAGRLLRELISRLKADGAGSLYLEVRAGNTAAVALYEGLGFTRTGLRRGYYADSGEDAVVLRKELGLRT